MNKKFLARLALILAGILVVLATIGISVKTAKPAEAATEVGFTYSELNCNWQGYTKGVYEDGVDLTWATGSGSTRKYIRAQRMATLLNTQVKASLYGLTECDSQMMGDLSKLMGSQWKYIGGDNDLHNRTGWYYDSSKWYPGTMSVTNLPGDPDGGYTGRRLLQVGFFRNLTGTTDPMISMAMLHLSSGNPEARDLQMDYSLDKMEGKVRLLAGDLNASSIPPATETDPCRLDGPRWQMACRGWTDPMARYATFQDYGDLTPGLPVDIISVSPAAQEGQRIRITSTRSIDTGTNEVADHNALAAGISYN